MMFSKNLRIFAFFSAVFYAASTFAYADTLTGKIVSIRVLENGQSEVVLSKGKERETIVLNSKTSVESRIPAGKLKAGATIYIAAKPRGGGGKGGFKGMKSPFQGIPKGMQKSMGLPSMPEIPGVPSSQPAEAAGLPQMPQLPQIPKVPKQKGQEAPAEQGQEQGRKPTQPPVQEPSEAEKNIYGKASADKPLLKSTGGSEESEPIVAKKVLSVKAVKSGVQVELQGPSGAKEQMTLSLNSNVSQAFALAGLRKNMQVQVETVKADNVKVAQKITVVS